MPPPPPPGPPPMPSIKASAGAGNDRNQLLTSIRQGAALRKAQTNDRSAPSIEGKPRPNALSNNGHAGGVQNSNGTPRLPPGPVSLGGIGGLMAGGIPKLRPTGRGRGVSNASSENPPVGIQVSMNPPTNQAVAANKRPSPPQPPPASNKPTINGEYTRTDSLPNPPLPNKPNLASVPRKPNLAPRPPTLAASPTSPIARPCPPSQASKPLLPPKSPSIASSPSNFSLPSSPPVLPNGRPPSVGRSQSVRLGMKPAPAPPMPNRSPSSAGPPNSSHLHSQTGLANPSGETMLTKASSSPFLEAAGQYPRPHPPREGHATLPRVPPPLMGGMTAGRSITTVVGSRPNERPPPPPPLRQIPPHPGTAPPPPPPPNVAPPQPPLSSSVVHPRHRTTPAPPPPVPLAMMDGAINGPPTVPPRDSSLRKQSIVLDEMERRFGTMFRPVSQLTAPEPFSGVGKAYPSQIAVNQSQRRAQAPQPPNLTHMQIGNKMWATNASDC